MYTGLKNLHSYTAYLTLAMLVIAIIYAAYSRANKKPFTKNNRSITLLALVMTHLQVVFGLILYFISPLGMENLSGATMKDSVSRLYALEHPLTMLIAAIIITIGYSKAKRISGDDQKNKKIVLFYSIGLILILLRIPWSAWLK